MTDEEVESTLLTILTIDGKGQKVKAELLEKMIIKGVSINLHIDKLRKQGKLKY